MTSSFGVLPVRRTVSGRGYGLAYTVRGDRSAQFLLPADFTHVRIDRKVAGKEGASGFARWRLREVKPAEVRKPGERDHGPGPCVRMVPEGPMRVKVTWNGGDYAGSLIYHGFGASEGIEVSGSEAVEVITVPGPGYLEFDTERWSVRRIR
ncbi:hypothetical protein ACG5V6_03705 [Streptomyces chitinivorans]|uniref:Uncharacterized protein n=1 Tax=Streptomyces chitinivorans TaxID=1257027 RepID=A0ABW7HN75_9ACTN